MCRRYTFAVTAAELAAAFPEIEIPDFINPRYNIAPNQQIAVVPNDGKKTVDFYRWGLIPPWAKDAKFSSRLINARGETVAEKPSFRAAYRSRRCLVLADRFFEWVYVSDWKKKSRFTLSSNLVSHLPLRACGRHGNHQKMRKFAQLQLLQPNLMS